ncbi:uncharacterized protein PAC_19606 [Phialocephala subalpina]|uniref:Uncharacterized protein n=1 Tax=Phialocephala subalpina TaxID=576137 RepID=A0A1L7XXF2_9HELO|nr:uncharacterized protein PAC_19606 [Phialocephala subalpina]
MALKGHKVPTPKELREQIIPRDFGTMEIELRNLQVPSQVQRASSGDELELAQIKEPAERANYGNIMERFTLEDKVEQELYEAQQSLDDEEEEMSSRGLNKFPAEDYTSEILALSMSAFREPRPPVPPPRILTYEERRARALRELNTKEAQPEMEYILRHIAKYRKESYPTIDSVLMNCIRTDLEPKCSPAEVSTRLYVCRDEIGEMLVSVWEELMRQYRYWGIG